jgi:hypothetical protein
MRRGRSHPGGVLPHIDRSNEGYAGFIDIELDSDLIQVNVGVTGMVAAFQYCILSTRKVPGSSPSFL